MSKILFHVDAQSSKFNSLVIVGVFLNMVATMRQHCNGLSLDLKFISYAQSNQAIIYFFYFWKRREKNNMRCTYTGRKHMFGLLIIAVYFLGHLCDYAAIGLQKVNSSSYRFEQMYLSLFCNQDFSSVAFALASPQCALNVCFNQVKNPRDSSVSYAAAAAIIQ